MALSAFSGPSPCTHTSQRKGLGLSEGPKCARPGYAGSTVPSSPCRLHSTTPGAHAKAQALGSGALPHTRHCQAMLPSSCLSLGLTREQQAQGYSLNLWGSGWGPQEKWYLLQPESLCGQGPVGRNDQEPCLPCGPGSSTCVCPSDPQNPTLSRQLSSAVPGLEEPGSSTSTHFTCICLAMFSH